MFNSYFDITRGYIIFRPHHSLSERNPLKQPTHKVKPGNLEAATNSMENMGKNHALNGGLQLLIAVIAGYGSKPGTPGEPQNSWDLWMFIPLKMVLIGIDPYPAVKLLHQWVNSWFSPSLIIRGYHRLLLPGLIWDGKRKELQGEYGTPLNAMATRRRTFNYIGEFYGLWYVWNNLSIVNGVHKPRNITGGRMSV